jgi:hypothetical protein
MVEVDLTGEQRRGDRNLTAGYDSFGPENRLWLKKN